MLKRLAAAKNKAESRAGGKTVHSMEKTREFTVNCDIKMVAVDVDGTFVHSEYTYDIPRYQRILSRMNDAGCRFCSCKWEPVLSVERFVSRIL